MVKTALAAVLLAALLVGMGAPALAGAVPPPGFQVYEASGVTVWIKTVTGSSQGAIFAVMRCGTGDEEPGETHCAHVAEHMVFRNHLADRALSLAQAVDQWKGLYNGWTGPDHTQFELTVPHDHIAEAAGLLMEALFPARIAVQAFEMELNGRLQNELQYMTTNGVAAPLNAIRSTMLAGTVYGEDIFASAVTDVTSDQILEYMQREYSPRRLLMVVISAADHASVVDTIGRQLTHVSAGEEPEQRTTRLDPSPVRDLRLREVGQPLVLVGAGVGEVDEAVQPYLTFAYMLAMGRLGDRLPSGYALDAQTCGIMPVQGAVCVQVGYRLTRGKSDSVAAGELAAAPMESLAQELNRLPTEVTEEDIAAALEAINAPPDLSQLPAGVSPHLYEAWQIGIATVPGAGLSLRGSFMGQTPQAVLNEVVDALTRHRAATVMTAVVARDEQQRGNDTLTWVLAGLVLVLAGAGLIVQRHRRRTMAR